MSREIVAKFQVTRTYQVFAYGESEEECFDNLEYVKDDDYEFIDEQVELVETEYANF
jgi:hypothetical protein